MACEVNNGIYYDIEDIISTETIADDAIAESSWYSNMSWVRRWLFKVRANGAYDIILYRRTSNNVSDNGTIVINRETATASNYHSIEFEAVGGYAFKVGIINRSGGNLEVQASVELFRE